MSVMTRENLDEVDQILERCAWAIISPVALKEKYTAALNAFRELRKRAELARLGCTQGCIAPGAEITKEDRELAVELTPDIGSPLIDHTAACQRTAAILAEFRAKAVAAALARQAQPGRN